MRIILQSVAEAAVALIPFSFRRKKRKRVASSGAICFDEALMRISKLSVVVLAFSAVLSAQVTLPKILSSHMVMQRDLPVHVWGMATPGQGVTVAFRGESRSVNSDPLGHWNAYLKPGPAGGPFTLTVTPGAAPNQAASQPPITLDDVMVGDVWVASGQSNMEFPLSHANTAAQDLPNATNPQIRLLMIRKRSADYAMPDADTEGWTLSNPDTAKEFSAVAWYFAKDIAARQHVTIGLIDATWGGTVGEAWVRLTALGEDPSLAPIFVSRGRMTDEAADAVAEQADEKRQQDEAKATGKPLPQFPWHPPLNSWGPGLLWNGMIAPLTPLPIRGALWYQGESNSALARVHSYDRVMRTLIEDWRRQWGIGDFPFLYVQISNFKSTPREDWAELREQQVRTLAMRNTAMAVTIDIGNPDDVHPTDKLDVGLRLARAARALTYGETRLEYSGPMFREATPESAFIRVWFDHAQGLNAKGGVLTGFEVAGRDGKYVPATATIDGVTIVASSADVAAPVYVRYGWANSPQCNLFNGEQLPASPFTSER